MNQLTVLDLNSRGMLAPPSYLTNVPSVVGKIPTGDTRNRLGLKGREFHVIKGGVEEGVIDTKHVDVVIVGATPFISRLYYGQAFVEGVAVAPTCYSVNGLAPAEDVADKQSDKCNTCKNNIVGSSLSGDNKSKACGFFRRIAVILVGDPENTVFQLDVKAMSLWGDGNAQKNQYSFNEYAKKLQAHNVDAGHVVTRLTFDPSVGVPKLFFQAIGYVSPEQVAHIVELIESNAIAPVLNVNMNTVDLSTEVVPQATTVPVAQDRPTLKPTAPTIKPTATKPTPQPVTRPVVTPVVRVAQPAAPVEDDTPDPPLKIRYGQPRTPAAKLPVQPVQSTDDETAALLAELET